VSKVYKSLHRFLKIAARIKQNEERNVRFGFTDKLVVNTTVQRATDGQKRFDSLTATRKEAEFANLRENSLGSHRRPLVVLAEFLCTLVCHTRAFHQRLLKARPTYNRVLSHAQKLMNTSVGVKPVAHFARLASGCTWLFEVKWIVLSQALHAS
jgi:hypothetical protein